MDFWRHCDSTVWQSFRDAPIVGDREVGKSVAAGGGFGDAVMGILTVRPNQSR
ncbi:hypothetical protein [Roseiconus lacunae]|uniref:hypothetical protein n=1 Tax=Roseiconus lacunae TaxID=2605694 RepID=UPI0013DD3CF0|nr:hypothetical protein [Roseiconus lacunae]